MNGEDSSYKRQVVNDLSCGTAPLIHDFKHDPGVVLTLDAGGTNMVFSAMQAYQQIVDDIVLPTSLHDLEKCLRNIREGFYQVKRRLDTKPEAISFAFPGPADYKRGIIGDLPNFPAFKGDVALGPMLEEEFNVPVFIKNDGALFALGEAAKGFLPWVNGLLAQNDIDHQYQNLIGITIGTGLGGGLIINGRLCEGDNAAGGGVWLMRNKLHPQMCAEEGACIRAVKQNYQALSGTNTLLNPKQIYEIGIGKRLGDQEAAKESFRLLGESVGDTIANILTLIDGIIVIGGGLAKAKDLFMSAILAELNGTYKTRDGREISRLSMDVYDMTSESEKNEFINRKERQITLPTTNENISYLPQKRVGIGISTLGTNRAVALGAYQIAISSLKDNG